MDTTEQTAKERLLQAACNLLMEGVELQQLSSRQIAKRANVGAAMINYYFQTKENLIAQALQHTVDVLSSQSETASREAGMSPYERIKQRGRVIGDFMARFPALANIMLPQHLMHPRADDNHAQMAEALEVNLREYFGDRKSERQIKILAMQLMAPLILFFLRHSVAQEQYGIDFYDEEQRNAFIDELADNLLQEK
jgi:AcrR family transcriptional regulator